MSTKKIRIKPKAKPKTKAHTKTVPLNSNSNSNSTEIINVSETNSNNNIEYSEPNITSTAKTNKTRQPVEPMFWMLQNKKEFPTWINKTFLKYRLTDKATKHQKGEFSPFPYQEFARDYMQEGSPYRGILLYHGLGSGKCVHPETEIFINNCYQRADDLWKKYADTSFHTTYTDTDHGTWVQPISPLTALSINEISKKLEQTTVINLYRQPINEEILEISLNNDLTIKLTKAHKLLTPNKGWTTDFGIGKYVAIPKYIYKKNGEQHLTLYNPSVTFEDIQRRDIFFVKIVAIRTFNYKGCVYDLEIQNHHNYLANGMLCHNTCTAIGIAENLKARNKLVILPASLKANFIGTPKKEGLKFCGDPRYATSNALIDERYTFLSSNASNSLQQLLKLGSLDNMVIIIDEVHNLISMITSATSKQGKEFYYRLMEAKNVKLIFLTGTPVVNFAFEAAIMLNLLRGYIEMLIFEIRYLPPAYGSAANLKPITDDIENIEHVDYVDHNIASKTIEVHLRIKSWHPDFQKTIEAIKTTALTAHDVKLFYRTIQNYTLYPEDEEEFYQYFMDSTDLRDEKIKNEDLFQRRMLGLVSYYRGAKPEFYPTVNPVKFVRVPMSNYQFGLYELIRSIERTQENRGASKGRGFSKLSRGTGSSQASVGSTFRVFSREFSNFVFPKDINRPFPKVDYIKAAIKPSNNSVSSSSSSSSNETSEINAQKNTKEMSKLYQSRINTALTKLWNKRAEYLSPKGLTIYSPKMRAMLEIIKRAPGIQLVYSDFRSLEGAQIFSMILAANGYQSHNTSYPYKNEATSATSATSVKTQKSLIHKFALWTGTEDHEERKNILTTLNSEENKHGDILKIIIITSAGAEGIDLKNVRGVHIMDPYWNEVRSDQVIGRAVRVNSHIDLPQKERTVTVFRYLSVFTPQQLKETHEKMSTDDYLLDLAQRKKRITDEVVRMMKTTAVDCTLNAADNEKDIKCLNFGTGARGLAYLPKLSKDVIFSKLDVETKTVKRKLKVGAISSNKELYYADSKNKKLYKMTKDMKLEESKSRSKPKLRLKVAFNNTTGDIYDMKAVQQGKLIQIGKVSQDTGKIVSQKV